MDHASIDGSPVDYVALTKRRTSVAGAEPYFIDGSSDTAFLVLHGWSASAESVRFLAAGLAAAGHAVLAPTLPGHGASSEDMGSVGPVDWNAAAREAARALRTRFRTVIVVGVSMGGSLSIQLAGSAPDLVDGLVTVNAPVFMGNPSFAREILSADLDEPLADWSTPSFFGDPVDEISYDRRLKKSGADLYAMCALAREMLPLVACPMLVIQSVLDPVVPKDSADEILSKVGAQATDVLWLDRSYHVSQLDLDRDRVVEAVLAFKEARLPDVDPAIAGRALPPSPHP